MARTPRLGIAFRFSLFDRSCDEVSYSYGLWQSSANDAASDQIGGFVTHDPHHRDM